MPLAELQAALKPYNVPGFRAKQIAQWLYQKGVVDFGAMTNLSKDLRAQLAQAFVIARPQVKARLDSQDGKTTKFLLEYADGTAIETVLMRQPYGNSICVSTQAGCNMGCAFCASTLHGMARDLTCGEILAQAVVINDMLREENGSKVDTMVIMGSGEPLMNYAEVLKFLRLIHEPYTLGMGYRNITLSTSGIVPRMYQLAEEGLPISLSVSLHAPNQELRSELMPINRKYPIQDVVAAARNYADKTKRRVTYEYILIDGVNDGEEQAKELVALMRGQLASVNLIPINPVVERNLLRPSKARIDWFEGYLASHHVNVTVRREMGTDIQAACGQLRNKHLEK
ncbi:MAG: 23S rRNA (adenine(2503)-C(2))-methyltransferase RlmN [Selenomonas sp.]|nr:23S rRNA (adenine(2503)-C(2))-methyltransferase RlmN [Selenomonas sp.]MBQ1808172.1 23S rRNA (adenine(2503)-C(2))-methyltransferase RlmN [Selenomonas sp.]MBQ2087372.1 23S rRNA (adenine(2503)-C(2))-methyltransferase RlmN [Selenomonas sp.]MBQ2137508.1 23S rRNA (adenine(2503)-C(2))-methyltransferase RlmN [Selenomonas sp.]MBQ5418797.1 23S rRNA (adenine(2503)-C(2))-methyltransferase RlmN [Selenomonas sp.]